MTPQQFHKMKSLCAKDIGIIQYTMNCRGKHNLCTNGDITKWVRRLGSPTLRCTSQGLVIVAMSQVVIRMLRSRTLCSSSLQLQFSSSTSEKNLSRFLKHHFNQKLPFRKRTYNVYLLSVVVFYFIFYKHNL